MMNTKDQAFLDALSESARRAYAESQREFDLLQITIGTSPDLPHDMLLHMVITARDLDKMWYELGLFAAVREAVQLRSAMLDQTTVVGLEASRLRARAARQWLIRRASDIVQAVGLATPSARSELLRSLIVL